jgi:hypothetical protein
VFARNAIHQRSQRQVKLLPSVSPTAEEVRSVTAGDDLIPSPDVVMNRAFTWSIVLRRGRRADETRVLVRLRMAPVKRIWLAKIAGELLDALTIAGVAAGLRERLAETRGGQ